jgi:hypothetical protein
LPPYSRGGCPERVHVRFRLSDLKEIKRDLGSFTTDPDWYIQTFSTIIQAFELAWKDVMLLLDQILTSLSGKEPLIRPLRQATVITYKSPVKSAPLEEEAKDLGVLTGSQEVPRMDPAWDTQREADKWARLHFIHLAIEGLKRARVKSLNYSQVTAAHQGPSESPTAFLQCLKEAIVKHTTVDPELQVREVLLRDKFLTQSAPDVRRKLQKLVVEGDKTLGLLVQMATSAYHNQDLTRWKENDRRHHDLVVALREFPSQQGLNVRTCTIVDSTLQTGVSMRRAAWENALTSFGTLPSL